MKKKQYFEQENRSKKDISATRVASAKDLLSTGTKVRETAAEEAYKHLSAKKMDGRLSAATSDAMLRRNAENEGWLAQSNHLLHNGMSTSQYIELEGAISTLEREYGGATMTAGYGNLSSCRPAEQRARNTRINDLPSANESMRRDRRRVDDGVEVILCPANFPFGTPQRKNEMIGRVRTRMMARMQDKSLSESARKKAHIVRTALAKDDAVYVSIVHDMMPAVASQEITSACLTQASFDFKEKDN